MIFALAKEGGSIFIGVWAARIPSKRRLFLMIAIRYSLK
jgi:hypothetical protein